MSDATTVRMSLYRIRYKSMERILITDRTFIQEYFLQMSCWALGDDHPVANFVLTLAEDNMSNARKQAVVERQRALDSLMAERLLEEERKSARELSDEQALEKEALTPVPERVWALRNIAATMALGDRSSRQKARELYSKAVELQQEFFGCENHPCLLGELWRFAANTCNRGGVS